jgi:uncharacterized membrane protein
LTWVDAGQWQVFSTDKVHAITGSSVVASPFTSSFLPRIAVRQTPTQSLASDCQHEVVKLLSARSNMLWTIFVILLILWLLGLVSSYTLGGFIHILLVLALVVLVINLLSGRRAV